LIVLTLGAALAAIFAPQITRYILAPGFAGDLAKEQLTINLLRMMLPSAVIFGLSGLAMGVLNSHQRFLVPALTPALYQLGLIFGVIFLAPSLGIYGLAWGVLLGSALHLLLQLPSLWRLDGRYEWTLGAGAPEVFQVMRLMGPRLLGVAVVQLNFWINTRLASQMIEGSVTGVVLAFSLMLMPQAAIAQSIAIAAMPMFSAQVALGKLDEMRSAMVASLRAAIMLSLPAAVGLILLREPIIVSLYQRGAFDAFSTQLVSWALLWFSTGLVGHAVVEILSRAFYSLSDTRTPVFIGALAMSLNIIFSYLFSSLFLRWGWLAHGGLALANSCATGLEAIVLWWVMRRRMQGLPARGVMVGAAQAAFCALVMGVFLWFWLQLSAQWLAWQVAVVGILLGAGVFVLTAWLIKIPELQSLFGAVMGRVRAR
jgi:putative peptidoglycan lipid II flippase